MISDVADGNNCISGQKEVFSHFFTQGHWTKSVQITEHHLSLCPGTHTHTHTLLQRELSTDFIVLTDHVIMQREVRTSLPYITLNAPCWPYQR